MADFEALEQAVRHQALDIAAQWDGAALQRGRFRPFGFDHSVRLRPAGALRRPSPENVHTLLGPVALQRAYYHCDACHRGVCPRDQALGLQGASLSPAITRLVGLTAAEGSFAKASEWLTALAGVDVETRQVERCAEALGRDIADDERSVTEQAAAAPAPTMYLGLGGTGVPVRPAEVEGRRGKQPDGSAKTREVKLATMWTAETRDKAGRPVRDRGSVSYNAAVESAASRDTDPLPSAFAQRAYREAQRGAGVAVRSGSRWRRSRGNGDAVANHDRVVADEHLFDEEPHDPLPLQDVEGLGRRPQACQERREGFGETQMRGAVASLFHQRVQLVSQRLLALTQQRHPLAQISPRRGMSRPTEIMFVASAQSTRLSRSLNGHSSRRRAAATLSVDTREVSSSTSENAVRSRNSRRASPIRRRAP